MGYKVIATGRSSFETPDKLLQEFDSLESAEMWRPSNVSALKAEGYTHLVIVPEGWVHTKFGAGDFARLPLGLI